METDGGHRSGRKSSRTGPTIIGAGCLFGLAPMIVSIVALMFGSGIGNVLHWYTLITVPIGLCIAVVGIVVTASRSTSQTAEANAAPVVVLDVSVRNRIRSRFVTGSGIALAASILGFFAAGFGDGTSAGDSLGIGGLLTAGLVVWVALSARKLSTMANFGELRTVQLVASVLVIIGNLGTVVGVVIAATGIFGGNAGDEWAGYEIVTLISSAVLTALSVASLVYTERIARQLGASNPN